MSGHTVCSCIMHNPGWGRGAGPLEAKPELEMHLMHKNIDTKTHASVLNILNYEILVITPAMLGPSQNIRSKFNF